MRVIKEFLLNERMTAPQMLYLPVGAEPIAVHNTSRGLRLQVLTSLAELHTELRTFKIYAAEETIYENKIRYIDNFESSEGRRHVLELCKD